MKNRFPLGLKSPLLKLRVHRAATGSLVWIGRFLLLLCAISLTTTPVTQRVWGWDHFLRGGQDFELTALMLLTALALVLVLSRHCRQCVDLLLAAYGRLGRKFTKPGLMGIAQASSFSTQLTKPVTAPLSSIYTVPLQI
jgi:hypothetical protein